MRGRDGDGVGVEPAAEHDDHAYLDGDVVEYAQQARVARERAQLAVQCEVRPHLEPRIGLARELVHAESVRMARVLAARGHRVDTLALDAEAIRDRPGFSPVTVDYSDAVSVIGTYEPRRDGDWLYGRGAGDMKAGLAANLYPLDALRRIRLQPAARVHVQSVVEEQCTGNGALHCLVAGYAADAAVIPEPEDEKLVRANVGVLWFTVEVRGRPVHVREADTEASAIEAMPRVIASLRALETRWNAEKGSHPYLADEAHPINFNVERIEGGDWASSVPASCRIDCRIAIYPEDVIYAGMPCLVYGRVAENIHGHDERVSLASLLRVTGAIALFVVEWCGVEPVDR